MKTAVKSFFKHLFWILIKIDFPFALLRFVNRRKFLILMYHGVSDNSVNNRANLDGKHVRVAKFREQLNYLRKKYNIVKLSALLDAAQKGGEIPNKCLALTFDDGYRNNYEYVFPVLKKYGIPAVIFPVTAYIDTEEISWLDKVDVCLSASEEKQVVLNIGDSEETYPLADRQQKSKACKKIKQMLKAMKEDGKNKALDKILKSLKADPGALKEDYISLSWDEIKEMSTAGIEFGAHTLTHPILTNLECPDMEREVKEAKELIGQKIKAPGGFSYPNGDFNKEVKNTVKKYYDYAVSMNYGYNDQDTDVFELRRAGVNDNFSFLYFVLSLYPDINCFCSKILGWLVKGEKA